MTRRPLFFKIWSVLIALLGAYYLASWVNTAPAERELYTLGVGIFCILMGLGAFAFSLVSSNRKDQ
ncbi:hypothetical protein [Robiginitomaculum antarcticum]|uniref:hypothetical protein n=1 Tax=Robiginitomaculum antarcticum TaxID=437507 RepID=UPI000367E4A5|nr:hypothetical protein [Robiginitomaculum antarcticum]